MQVLTEAEFHPLYEDYLKTRGINSQKIKKQKYKTPDYQIFYESNYCLNEVKIPELIFDPLQGVYVFKTMHSKLLEFIPTAIKQLETFDKKHQVPWVITFAANHMQMNWKKFTDAITGGVEFDGALSPDFTNTHVFQRTKAKILVPDLYVWLQVSENKEKIFQASHFTNPNSNHLTIVASLVNELSKIKVSSMDNKLDLKV